MTKGSTPFLVLVFVGIVIFLVCAGAFYYLQFTGGFGVNTEEVQTQMEEYDETGVIISDDIETIEAQLDETDIGSIDDDFEEIESSVNEL